MEKSDAVRAALSAMLSSFGSPQMGSVFADAISMEPGTLFVGTDPEEWWDSPEALTRAVNVQGEELEGARARITHCEGWVEGDVGWGAAKAEVAGPEGSHATMRVTATYARRGGQWKVVQAHASVGLPNEDIIGKELTV